MNRDDINETLAAFGFEPLVTMSLSDDWVCSYPVDGDPSSWGVTRYDGDVDADGDPTWWLCGAAEAEVDEDYDDHPLLTALREAARRNGGGA
jgi:hypothetical protein